MNALELFKVRLAHRLHRRLVDECRTFTALNAV